MKRYLLDSNALSLFILRRQGVYDRALAARRAGAVLGTGTPVAAEILGGTMYSESWQTNLPRVEQALSLLRIWPFELPAAREYARVYAELRRVGIQMQAIDRMTAAIGLTTPNCTVVTNDSDFKRVSGLEHFQKPSCAFRRHMK
jgi:predicted nucleic acid-binding protein